MPLEGKEERDESLSFCLSLRGGFSFELLLEAECCCILVEIQNLKFGPKQDSIR